VAASSTLAEIERALARRIGPFRLDTIWVGSANLITVESLKSTLDTGQWEDLYILRRGIMTSGAAVTVAAGDRVRSVGAYEYTTGGLTPDRGWTVAPVPGEAIELHHLDPTHELRPAVLDGLKRCYFEDYVDVTLATTAPERNLTTSLPWLADIDWLRAIEHDTTAGVNAPVAIGSWKPFNKAGNVWIRIVPDPAPTTLKVTALRPADTLVNGLTSSVGPLLDTDTLPVDAAYAAAAGHVMAWEMFPWRLKGPAEEGLQMAPEQAAARFTTLSRSRNRRRVRQVGFGEPFTWSSARVN